MQVEGKRERKLKFKEKIFTICSEKMTNIEYTLKNFYFKKGRKVGKGLDKNRNFVIKRKGYKGFQSGNGQKESNSGYSIWMKST